MTKRRLLPKTTFMMKPTLGNAVCNVVVSFDEGPLHRPAQDVISKTVEIFKVIKLFSVTIDATAQ
jgi:hypothetical protein